MSTTETLGIESKIDDLKGAILDRPPVCMGTLPVAPEDLVLYFGKESADAG